MLSHHECHILALVRKWQPTTAYFVRKTLPRSLASTFSDSPGSVYPAIERLRRGGLILATAATADGRKTELLSCSPAGEAAVGDWLVRSADQDMLPEDPWRTRMLFAEALSPEQRQRWLAALRGKAEAQLADIDDRAALAVDRAFLDAAENARLITQARIVWIERMIARGVISEAD